MKQYNRPTLAQLMVGELDSVGGGPAMDFRHFHGRMFAMFTLTTMVFGTAIAANGMHSGMSAAFLFCNRARDRLKP